jgi:hypothetical protein
MDNKCKILEVLPMFANFGSRNTSASTRAKQHRRYFYLILASALLIGSAGETLPVSAEQFRPAPLAQSEYLYYQSSYLIRVIMPKGPICVGRDYQVTVKITKFIERRAENNSAQAETNWAGTLVEPIGDDTEVDGSVKNPSIGTLSPARAYTGFPNGEGGPGEAIFKFHANQAGTTDLLFDTGINGFNSFGRIDGKGGESITVVNCDYKITMTYDVQQSGPGYFGILYGKLETLIKRDADVYKGEGILETTRMASIAGCSFSSSGMKNPTTFTGTLVDAPVGRKELQLTIQYGPGTHTESIACYGGGGGGTETVDPSGYLTTSVTLPENGGTKSFLVNFAGWDGTLLITVVPVNSSGQ